MRNVLRWRWGFVFSLGLAGHLNAQQVLAPPPPEFASKTNLVAVLSGTNQTEITAPDASTTHRRLWDLGPLHLHPHLFYSLSYGNGIQSTPGNHSKTFIHTFSPGMAIEIGPQWHLDYTPTLRYYSSHEFEDGLDHSVILNWGATRGSWAFGASQSYVSSSTPLVETASQTGTETYATVLSAACQLNGKVSLSFAVNQTFHYVDNLFTNQPLSDSKTWSTTEGFNYQLWPQLTAGATIGFTYDELNVGPDMTSEELQFQLAWKPGNKLNLSLHGGFEDRQFLNSDTSNALNPIFGFSLVYHVFEVTTLALSADRNVGVSYFENQYTESAGFQGGIHQRLLKRLYVDVTGGFTSTSYRASTSGLPVHRTDARSFVNVRLSCPFLQRGIASVFYDWSDNSSNQNGFGYTSDQVGVELGYRF